MDNRSYWHGELFIDGANAWAVDDDLETVWLGKADVVLPALRGETPVPEEIKGRARRILLEMIEEKRLGQTEHATLGPRVRRGRRVQPAARQ